MKRDGALLRAAASSLLCLLLLFAVQDGLTAALLPRALAWLLPETAREGVRLLGAACALAAALAAAGRCFPAVQREKRAVSPLETLLWLFASAGLLALTAGMQKAFGAAGEALPSGPALCLLGINAGLLSPALEEMLFRGRLAAGFRRWGPGAEVLAPALLFALAHRSVAAWPGAFAAGLLFGAAALRTGGWHLPAGMHALYNLLALWSLTAF